jgi:hypothetical protein
VGRVQCPACRVGFLLIGWSKVGAVPSAHADVFDLAFSRVIWRRTGCEEGEGPGAKLVTA